MKYQLYHGDCLDIMPTLEAGSVDAIISDWPYGQTACKWDSVIPLDKLWPECKRVIKPNVVIVLFGAEPFSSQLRLSNPGWYKHDWIWKKDKGTNIYNVKIMPLMIHEECLVFSDGKPKTYNPQMTDGKPYKPRGSHNVGRPEALLLANKPVGYADDFNPSKRYPVSIQEFSNHLEGDNRLHPTQKPVALLEYLIRTYTNPGDLVLDNTMGSASTGVACLRQGRRFIGIEKDAEYFEIAQKRMKETEQELSGEFKPINGNGKVLSDLPLFEKEASI